MSRSMEGPGGGRWLAVVLGGLIAVWSAVGASGPGAANDFGGRRVLFLGIDGCRPDALRKVVAQGLAPHLTQLIESGTVTWRAVAGGPLGTAQQQPTVSGPGWTSFFTGTWGDRHHVTGNGTPAYDDPLTASSYLQSQAPSFATRLSGAVPTVRVSAISSWNWIEDYLVAAPTNLPCFHHHEKGVGANYAARDSDVRNKAVTYLAAYDPDVLMLHFDQVDGAGHAYGFSPEVPNYLTAIANVDALIGQVLGAVRSRPQYSQEKWLVVVSTDHGGIGNGHGGQSVEERTIFLIVSGPGVAVGRESDETVGQPALAHLVFKYLGVPVESAWQWAERSFAIPPTAILRGAGTRALIEIVQPAEGGIPGCTGIELRRGGTLVQTLPANTTVFTDTPPLPATGTTAFAYEVRFAGTAESNVLTTVTLGNVPADEGPADTNTALVLHLPFDGDGQDVSGAGNHAVLVGGPGFTAGRFGQALVVESGRYANLPTSLPGLGTQLNFGSRVDFTVAFWVRSTASWSADPVFISNKNWLSGSNPGWVIAAENNGQDWQWNFKGDGRARMDFDPQNARINDGQWHLIAVSHSREGDARFHHDGLLLGSVGIAGAGSVDTSFPLNIGTDGTGVYPMNVPFHIDDVRIWRRALTGTDIAALYGGAPGVGAAYAGWASVHFTPMQLADPLVSGPDADPDRDGVINLGECAFGTSPWRADASPVAVAGLGMRYVLPANGVGDPGVAYQAGGIRYVVEYASDLADSRWVPAGDRLVHPVEIGPAAGGRMEVRARFSPAALAQPGGFVRLKAILQ